MNTQFNKSTDITVYDSTSLVRDTFNMPDLPEERIRAQSDLAQLMLHNISNIKKNKSIISSSELSVHESKNLTEGAWSDVYTLEQLNKISVFDHTIRAYKDKLSEISTPNECFAPLAEVSKELTISILKTLSIRDRGRDMESFINALSKVQTTPTNIDAYIPFYNILLYSIPYAFSLVFDTPELAFVMSYSPYEYCANTLQSLNLSLSTVDISWTLRAQANLEGNLPNMGFYRNLYEVLRPLISNCIFAYNHRYQYIMLGTTSAARYLLPPTFSLLDRHFMMAQNRAPLLTQAPNTDSELREWIWLQIIGHYNE